MLKNDLTTSLKVLPIFAILACSSVEASAYQLWAQTANSVGYAHADMAALADDSSTAWYNPAGMTRLCDPEISFGGSFVNLHTEFNGSGGFANLTDLIVYEEGKLITTLTQSLTEPFRVPRAVGNTAPSIGALNIVYPMHFSGFDVALGLAIDAPWGLETDYRYSKVRSYAERTYIESLQINPSIAIRIGNLSVGGGYGSEYMRTQFTASFVDYGAFINLKGREDTWNFGMMYEFSHNFRFGVTYRPDVNHHLKGNSSILFDHGSASLNLKTPGTLTAGVFLDVNPCWSLMGTIAYSSWNKVKSFEVFTGIPEVNPPFVIISLLESLLGGAALINNLVALDTSVATLNLSGKDTIFAAVGTKYKANEYWTLKAGFAYDETPTSPKTRELRIPDSDRYHVALGARCDFNEWIRADVGIQYIYLPRTGIKNNPILAVPSFPPTIEATIGSTTIAVPIDVVHVPPKSQGFNGNINSSAFLFSVQVTATLP